MSDLVEVVFELDTSGSPLTRWREPTGNVEAIIIPGHGNSGRVGESAVRATVELPAVKAVNLMEHHQRCIINGEADHNCLTCVAAFQSWPITTNELNHTSAPKLVDDSALAVSDIRRLTAGETYGVISLSRTVSHGMIGVGMENRHVDVDGLNGRMRYANTSATVRAHSSRRAPASVVILTQGSYRESKPSLS